MENSIEEAVKTMERWVEYEKNNKDKINKADELIYIQETILSDYKRVLKENEHKTEKIENQKAELAILNEKQKDFNKLQNTLSSYKGQFRRQEKENEKLRKQLNEENKRCMMLAIEKQDYFEKYRYNLQQNESLTKEFSNVIPIQEIKDIIEELNRKIDKSIDNSKGGLDEEFIEKAGELLTQKRILLELLRRKK